LPFSVGLDFKQCLQTAYLIPVTVSSTSYIWVQIHARRSIFVWWGSWNPGNRPQSKFSYPRVSVFCATSSLWFSVSTTAWLQITFLGSVR
jgi:hypothetical protein